MRHIKGFKQLSRTHSHRKALYKNMAEALFKNERIMTTKEKAKEIRRVTEKMITRAKEKTLHNIRLINRLIKNKAILMKLFDEIAPRYKERKGGYTRIIKLNRRKGDGASMAYLELIGEANEQKKKKKVKKVIAKDNKPETNKQEINKKETTQPEEIKKRKATKKIDIKETKKIEEENKEKTDGKLKKNDKEIVDEKDKVVKIVKGKKKE